MSILNHSCRMQNEIHVTGSPWRNTGKGITWSYLTIDVGRACYFIFIMLNGNFVDEAAMFIMWSLFLTETRLHISVLISTKHIFYLQNKQTTSAFLAEVVHWPFHVFPYRFEWSPKSSYNKNIFSGSRVIVLEENYPPDNCTLDDCFLENCPPDNYPRKIALTRIRGKLSPHHKIFLQNNCPHSSKFPPKSTTSELDKTMQCLRVL